METHSRPSAELLTHIQPRWRYLAHEASCTGDQHILSRIVFWDAHHDDSPPILIWTKAFKKFTCKQNENLFRLQTIVHHIRVFTLILEFTFKYYLKNDQNATLRIN